jgi:hypothetical protein
MIFDKRFKQRWYSQGIIMMLHNNMIFPLTSETFSVLEAEVHKNKSLLLKVL